MLKKKVIKVIEHDNMDDFIGLCKYSFRKILIAGLIALSTLFAFICAYCFIEQLPEPQYNAMSIIRAIVITGMVLSGFIFFLFLISFLGTMSGGGSLFARLSCKTEEDWLNFAKYHTFIPETIILTKRLELEKKEVIEILLDSCELRCKNKDTGADEVLNLGKPFKEVFLLYTNNELSSNEVILDLSRKQPVAITKQV